MTLPIANLPGLVELLARHHERGEKLPSLDLRALNQITEHTPADMTVTVEAGLTLGALQAQLATHRQWLPLDPPHGQDLTVGALLAENLSGPRRFSYGTVRDYLLGLTVVLADNRVIHSGGKVVKNVAGYDLLKLFIGARGSLGVIVSATFKLRPLPEAEEFVEQRCDSPAQAATLIESVIASELTPVVLDWHNLSTLNSPRSTVVVGFAGTRAEVDWQLGVARQLGLRAPSSLEHERRFWSGEFTAPVGHASVLPASVHEAVTQLGPVPFVARAGNGVVWHRGGRAPETPPAASALAQRVKAAYDPKNILPDLPT